MNLFIDRSADRPKLLRKLGLVALAIVAVLWALRTSQQLGPARQLFWANVGIQVLFASSVAFLYRVVGAASFGQAIFFGGAAYAVALVDETITNSLQLLLVGIAVGAVFSAVVGVFLFRVSGLRFSILTLALGQAIFLYANKQSWTGGETGLYGVQRNSILGVDVMMIDDFIIAVAVIAVLGLLAIRWIETSRMGVVMHAMRSSEDRASALGYSVTRYRYAGFVLGGAFAGLCGALHGLLWGLVSTDLLHWKTSGDPILMTLVGGMQSILGPIVGSIGYLLLVDRISGVTSSWLLWVGAVLLVVVLVAPAGVVGLVQQGYGKARARLRRDDVVDTTA